jgi:hypothetical protein
MKWFSMTDGKLAVIGLGSIGSMALGQDSRLSNAVTGFEAASPAHGRSAVGGITHLFHMLSAATPATTPSLNAPGLRTDCAVTAAVRRRRRHRTSTPRRATPPWPVAEGSGIYCATGFSGAGFKNATGYGGTAAREALDKLTICGLDRVRPERFSSRQPAS